MNETHDNSVVNGEQSRGTVLPGSIVFDTKPSGVEYARYFRYEKGEDGSYHRYSEHLGKVIDKENGIFQSKKLGLRSFSLEKGYGDVPEIYNNQQTSNLIEHLSFEFGDIWMVDQIFKQIGLTSVLDNLIPEARDTLKALVSFRALEDKAYSYANIWYAGSFARVLYPNAKLESQRISEFQALLGQEEIYRNFFHSYLSLIGNKDSNNSQISFPILIDSTGLQNDIKTYITALNNHNGVVNNEIRLIYIFDKKTKLPIYFRYVAGNIIDNSTLINTINQLASYNIDVELIIMDAGYYSSNNLEQLISQNIPFIIRMTKNRKEYKELMAEHGTDLRATGSSITYGTRALYGKKVVIDMYNRQLFAYVMLDIKQQAIEETEIAIKYNDEEQKDILIREHSLHAGNFIILSSLDYDLNDIIPMYYTRQEIEQVFDISKTYASILPLRVHSEETFRGMLMIAFISTIVYSSINIKLFTSKYCANMALYIMKRLRIDIYESCRIIRELNKDQNEIFSLLGLECPFVVETGNPLRKKSLITSLKSNRGKRGRPKGSKNKSKQVLQTAQDKISDTKRGRGRPKGSKNKDKKDIQADFNLHPENLRKRGRPRGSKNKG
jgi:hypothetical protein